MQAQMPQDFDTDIDEWTGSTKIQNLINEGLKDSDDGELYVQSGQSESLNYLDGSLRDSSFNVIEGFGFRAVRGEQVGFGHSSELTEDALGRAIDAASIVNREGFGEYDVSPQRINRLLYTDKNPIISAGFETKTAMLAAVNDYARSKDPRIVQVGASISTAWSRIEILRAGGERYCDIRPSAQIIFTIVMAENDRMETGMSAFGGRVELTEYLKPDFWQEHVDDAVRMAAVNMTSLPAPAGKFDVVLGAGWPGIMLHEAVGHGLEADAVRKGTSVYAGQEGKQVAAKGVTVVDNGLITDARGSLAIDDEGTPTEETILIEDGILKGYMQDRQNARLMGSQSTGNCRRESYAHMPMPRMTNTYMENGNHDSDEILASMQDGIYAVNFGGGQVDVTSGDFTFSCTEAYRVRNGKKEEAIKGATLIGNGPEAMRRITMIGNDRQLDPGIGVCGKQGQSIPVGVGQPTVKMADITVGGTN